MKIADFTKKFVTISTGLTYSYIDQAPRENAAFRGTALCFHGFVSIEFSYGWRYQINDLSQRGYRVIVPDMLGYDKPMDNLKPYSFLAAVNAAVEVLEHEKIEGKVAILGHDWGGFVAWRFLQYQTDRVKCLVSLCTPPFPAAQAGEPRPTMDSIIQKIPSFGYQKWFSSEDGTDFINSHAREFIYMLYSHIWSDDWKPQKENWTLEGKMAEIFKKSQPELEKLPITSNELEEYIETFKKGGMRGPLSWYKTSEVNYEEEIAHKLGPTFPTNVPCFLLVAEHSGALPPSLTNPNLLKQLFPGENIKKEVLEGADHWLLQDSRVRDKVVKTVGDWVDEHVDN
ncbi:hypothetical protein CROQUDRAFT_36025 [Cronartium quercuum f. sp. fusiforme G11]|uniref:AB hydrolase-1 domain-containing protein n=1 Tax=Cronartium quercuum f. sp. fusiforme G11 TaxID=708437 RepID=A0A9P6NXE3_9BASI|nr:hypothetical protein CROQUDRAFT_36025 [Cronartium quercuum f. sp. fusiforme G11]